jgi:hypothetical protein
MFRSSRSISLKDLLLRHLRFWTLTSPVNRPML